MTQRLSDYQQFPAHFPHDTTRLVLNMLDTVTGPKPAHTVTVSTDWLWVVVPLFVIGAITVWDAWVAPVYGWVTYKAHWLAFRWNMRWEIHKAKAEIQDWESDDDDTQGVHSS